MSRNVETSKRPNVQSGNAQSESREATPDVDVSTFGRLDVSLASCPVPKRDYDRVLLGHGSGGRLTAELIRDVFLGKGGFANPVLSAMEDAATLTLADTAARLAFTTDSFVVQPLFFTGGDIGTLAACGTINDLAMAGAKPLYMAAAFILQEGLPIDTLQRIVQSMRRECDAAGVTLVAGDTKVIDRRSGGTGVSPVPSARTAETAVPPSELFITTTGIGIVQHGRSLSIANVKPGDAIILSGTIGDHGIAIMSAREGLEFETQLQSDCASLHELAAIMLETCPQIRCLRDPTRGGISSALNEIAAASSIGIELDEAAIPVRPEVHAACEMLGFDPLYVANEGKLLAAVPAEHAEGVLRRMQSHPLGERAAIIGRAVDDHRGLVVLRSLIGGARVVSMLSGEQLPRIC